MHPLICQLLSRALNERPEVLATREQALELVSLPEADFFDLLCLGGTVRSLYRPHSQTRCGIVNAKSGRCTENCAFCAQSRHYATDTPVYPLLAAEQLVEKASHYARYGVDRFGIVTSGLGPSNADIAILSQAAQRIRSTTRIGLCASLGLLTPERAEQLRQAGFTSYHHNLETSERFFPSICSTHAYERDVQTVRVAKQAGFRVCSGGLFGLGETWADRIDLALLLNRLNVDSIPVNFLIPVPGTPLGNRPMLPAQEALRIIVLLRVLNPRRDIVLCGGRLQVLGQLHPMCFAAGANAIMTGDYLTRKGNTLADDLSTMQALGLAAQSDSQTAAAD